MMPTFNAKQVWLGTAMLLVLQLFFQHIPFISLNIILLAVASIWVAFSPQRQWTVSPIKLALVALFLLNLSGLASQEGKFEMEKKLSLLLFPLLFSVCTLSQGELQKIYKIFFISCLVGLMFIYGRLGYHFLKTHELLAYHEMLEGTGLHPSYCILYMLTAFFSYAMLLLTREQRMKHDLLLVVGLLLAFLPFLALAAAKLQIINFLVCLLVFFIFLRKQINIWVPVGVLGVTVVAMLAAYSLSPQVQDRMRDISQASQEIAPNDTNQTSTSARKYMWQSALKVVQKNPILGVGTGNEAAALMVEYAAIDFQFGMHHNTDAHNQFMATTISHGVIGLLLLVFVFVYPLTKRRFTSQPLFWFFYLPVLLTAMVESIFGVQKGIVFFCLFLMIFDVFGQGTKKTDAP